MKLVVGLGNPGAQYENTRHNVGFQVIDVLEKTLSIPCTREKFHAYIGEGIVGSEKILLCKPQTFMNLSGESVTEVCRYYSDLDVCFDMVVVYDDMDFPPGHLRLRQKGSAGGHNGIKSLIRSLGTDEFPRIRVGIGHPMQRQDAVSYVLGRFSKDELPLMDNAIRKAAAAIEFSLQHSFVLTMNRFNDVKG